MATKRKTKKVTFGQKVKQIIATGKKRWSVYTQNRPHHSFKRTYHAKHQLGGERVAPIRTLITDTFKFMWLHKKLFLGLVVLYSVFTFVFVGSLSQVDFVALREATKDVMSGNMAVFGTMLGLFGGVLDGFSLTTSSELQQFIGIMSSFIFWLAVVWATRMLMQEQKITIRDALYNCASPLIPSLLVMLALLAQLLPALLGLALWAIADTSGWLQNVAVALLFGAALVLCFTLSAYWVSSSLLALVVVTLPGMYPWRALSAASSLIVGQRWRLSLHVLLFVLLLLVAWAIVITLSLLIDNWLRIDWLPLIPVLIQLVGSFTLTFMGVYIYKLYRSLL